MQVPPCPPDVPDVALGVCSCPGEQRAEHTAFPSGLLVFPLRYPISVKLGLVREEQQAARSGSWPQGPADTSHEGCAHGWGWHRSHVSHTGHGPGAPTAAPCSSQAGTRDTTQQNHIFPKPLCFQGYLLPAASTCAPSAASHLQTPQSGFSHVQTKPPAFGADSQLLKGRKKACLRTHANFPLISTCPAHLSHSSAGLCNVPVPMPRAARLQQAPTPRRLPTVPRSVSPSPARAAHRKNI